MTESVHSTATDNAERLNPSSIRIAGIKWVSVVGGKYKVWTKKMGSGSLKVLLLHGGPGFPHDYLECFESFLPEAGIEMYYYDQLGCGNSDQPEDSSLWTLERYLEEVEEVRKGLGLTDFILFGHSWGGILTMEYALRHQNDGHLKAIVVSNMVASVESFLRRVNEWKKVLSPDTLEAVNQIEEDGDWTNPEYERIMMDEIYPLVMCRIQPWPEPLTRSFRLVNQSIYVQMQGHSEFVVTGNLKGWDVWNKLPYLRPRVLILGAEHDEMDPEDCRKMAEIIPNGEVVVCPEGSHMCFYDAQDHFFKHLLAFLKSLT